MSSKIKIRVYNSFHNTSVNLLIDEYGVPLTHAQIYRARRTLCGMASCTCGGCLSQRGPQNVRIEEIYPGCIIIYKSVDLRINN